MNLFVCWDSTGAYIQYNSVSDKRNFALELQILIVAIERWLKRENGNEHRNY